MTPTPKSDSRPSQGMSRRVFFNIAWLGAVVTLVGQGLRMSVELFTPRFKKGEFGGVFDVGAVNAMPSPNDPPRNYPAGKFWLLRQGEQLKAYYKCCTHLDCLFSWNDQEQYFICPCHGSTFHRNGSMLSGPAPRSLDEFVVQIILPNGELFAETHPEKGLTMPAIEQSQAEGDAADNTTAQTQAGPVIPADSTVLVDTGRKIAGVAKRKG